MAASASGAPHKAFHASRMTAEPMLQSIELPTLPLLAGRVLPKSNKAPLSRRLHELFNDSSLDERLTHDTRLEKNLVDTARELGRRAYPANRTTDRQSATWIDHESRDELHRALLLIYRQHVQINRDGKPSYQFHPLSCRLMHELEAPWERDMLRRAHGRYDLDPEALPAVPSEFAAWYRDTAFAHPLYEHDLYSFVATEATRDQLEWFFRMECAGEAAFDDLVALAQVGTRGDVKIEMASNYWDEMGRGRSHAVHTHLFHRLISGLSLKPPDASELPWQVLAGVNVMLWSCIPRRNAYRAQGTLGAVELLAPQRCTRLVHGARRVGITKKTVVYYGAHAVIDIGHAEGWLAHVIEPQVQTVPSSRVGIAEGLIVRADASLDYFDHCLARARTLAA